MKIIFNVIGQTNAKREEEVKARIGWEKKEGAINVGKKDISKETVLEEEDLAQAVEAAGSLEIDQRAQADQETVEMIEEEGEDHRMARKDEEVVEEEERRWEKIIIDTETDQARVAMEKVAEEEAVKGEVNQVQVKMIAREEVSLQWKLIKMRKMVRSV